MGRPACRLPTAERSYPPRADRPPVGRDPHPPARHRLGRRAQQRRTSPRLFSEHGGLDFFARLTPAPPSGPPSKPPVGSTLPLAAATPTPIVRVPSSASASTSTSSSRIASRSASAPASHPSKRCPNSPPCWPTSGTATPSQPGPSSGRRRRRPTSRVAAA
jgi:hypothetical protein